MLVSIFATTQPINLLEPRANCSCKARPQLVAICVVDESRERSAIFKTCSNYHHPTCGKFIQHGRRKNHVRFLTVLLALPLGQAHPQLESTQRLRPCHSEGHQTHSPEPGVETGPVVELTFDSKDSRHKVAIGLVLQALPASIAQTVPREA